MLLASAPQHHFSCSSSSSSCGGREEDWRERAVDSSERSIYTRYLLEGEERERGRGKAKGAGSSSLLCLVVSLPLLLCLAGGNGKIVIWLILPVVICLSQRLSHACLSISKLYSETANGSLNQLSFI